MGRATSATGSRSPLPHHLISSRIISLVIVQAAHAESSSTHTHTPTFTHTPPSCLCFPLGIANSPRISELPFELTSVDLPPTHHTGVVRAHKSNGYKSTNKLNRVRPLVVSPTTTSHCNNCLSRLVAVFSYLWILAQHKMNSDSQGNPTHNDAVVDMGERTFPNQLPTCFLVCLRPMALWYRKAVPLPSLQTSRSSKRLLRWILCALHPIQRKDG